MKSVLLGRTGLEVSALSFGTMTFGDGADEATSAQLFERCREAGITTFDCANKYMLGATETIVGKLIQTERDQLVVTSKVGQRMFDGPNGHGLHPQHIMSQCEQSLRRLQCEYIDIYFVHCFDPRVPMEVTLQALHGLVERGLVRYLGVSNWSAWQIALAEGISRERGWHRFSVMQPMYSLVKRQVEVELLPFAQALSLGVLSYSPLGAGLLTGRYGTSADGDSAGRLATNQRYHKRYGEPQMYAVAQQFAALAAELGYHPSALATAWVAHHPAITAPLIGARSLEQLEPTLAAASITLDDDTYQRISALVSPPPLATDRSEERQ